MGMGISLKKKLEECNVTVAELSRRTGISSNTLYAIIRRDSEIPLITLTKIVNELKINLSEFMDNDIKNESLNKAIETFQSSFGNNNAIYGVVTKSLERDLYRDELYDSLEKLYGKMDGILFCQYFDLLEAFKKLNNEGKNEAVKQVSNLAKINDYLEAPECK